MSCFFEIGLSLCLEQHTVSECKEDKAQYCMIFCNDVKAELKIFSLRLTASIMN